MTPKVSVVIPVYNVECYLEECLNSVLASTLDDIEVICVDDCSPDRCPQMLDEYAERDQRIQVVHLSGNGGPGNARNIGLSRACGQYVYFFDADDMIVPEALEKLVERSDADELDVLWFDAENIFEREEYRGEFDDELSVRSGAYPDGVLPGVEMLDLFVSQKEWTVYIQRQLIRRQFLEDEHITFPLFITHQDEVFSFEVAVAAKRSAYVREQYFLRRWRPDSLSTDEKGAIDFRCYLEALGLMGHIVRKRNCYHAGALKQLGHMYQIVGNNHPYLLEDGDDIDSLLPRPELRFGYDVYFASLQDSFNYLENIDYRKMERIAAAKRVFLYGAGRVADKVFSALDSEGIAVSGVIVQDAKANPATKWCHPVLALDEFSPEEGDLIVIAITEEGVPPIARKLDELGWNWMSWRNIPPLPPTE